MPTYEYECKSCSHGFEIFQSMSDEPVKNCPECGKEVRRLIFGGAGVIFKGSGFYVTDKGKQNSKTSGSKDENPKSDASPVDNSAKSPCAGCPAEASKQCPASSGSSKSEVKNTEAKASDKSKTA